MIALITGLVISEKLFQPNDGKGKAYQSLGIAQSTGKDSSLIKVKDYDLNSIYQVGASFEKTCNVREWAFNGRSGLAVTVTDGDLLEVPVNYDTSPEQEPFE